MAAWQEVRRRAILVRLRRRLARQRQEQERFVADLGVRLLAAGTTLPGSEALVERFRHLSPACELAHRQGRAGDRQKTREAARLEEELRSLYVEFGQKALASGAVFEGAAVEKGRFQERQAAIARTQAQIEERVRQRERAPARTRRLVVLGFLEVAALVLLAGTLGWQGFRANTEKTPNPEAPAEVSPAVRAEKPTLSELFKHLAPAVPLVEAVGMGTGSGFLVKQGGKYLVVTNRHVVENAHDGVLVHFLFRDGKGEEQRFTVSQDKLSVFRVHRSADVAVLDVSSAAPDIDQRKIEEVQLAPVGQKPQVGQHVFAIGHPGGGETVLTSTLSEGIVSAVGRKHGNAHFLQVTVPMNPGNSGGPLFDDAGRVVGVNTFGFRKSEDTPLEALNFALEGDYVHELLTDPRKSLDAEDVAAVLNPPQPERPETLDKAIDAKVKRFLDAGYRRVERKPKIFRLGAGKQQVIGFRCRAGGTFVVVAVGKGTEKLNLAVYTERGAVIASDVRGTPDPDVTFQPDGPGVFSVVIINPTGTDALVGADLLKK